MEIYFTIVLTTHKNMYHLQIIIKLIKKIYKIICLTSLYNETIYYAIFLFYYLI